MMHITPSSRSGALIVLALAGAGVGAEEASPLTLQAAYAVQTDDNLFRLPDGGGGSTERGDRIGISTLGLQFHTQQGLQQFALDASLVNYHYQNNASLGYTAQNFAAGWQWAVTPRLRGNLSANQQERPASSTGDTSPNQQTQTRYRADANYEVDGPWHVVGGVSQEKVSNQTPLTAGQDYRSNQADAGIRYEAASGSYVQVSAKRADGKYLNDASAPASALDTQFNQLDQELLLHWALTAASAADFRASAFERKHPTYAQRDFSGVNWGANLNWSLSEKTGVDVGLQHELAAFATANSNFSVTDRLLLGWRWQLGSKTQLRLRHDMADVVYRGTPLGVAESTRHDTTGDTSLSLLWQPALHWSVSTELHRLVRSSSQAGLDYTSNQFSVSGQFNY